MTVQSGPPKTKAVLQRPISVEESKDESGWHGGYRAGYEAGSDFSTTLWAKDIENAQAMGKVEALLDLQESEAWVRLMKLVQPGAAPFSWEDAKMFIDDVRVIVEGKT